MTGFWDKISGVYDLFSYVINRKVNRQLCEEVISHVKENDHVLECACGTGMITRYLAGKCRKVTATDNSKGMLRQTERKCRGFGNVAVEYGDILDLDYPDETFDAVVGGNVIHLLDDPYKALSEINRVCRKNGLLIIPTYVNDENSGKTSLFARSAGKAGADFKRQFTFSNYGKFFEEAGYQDIRITAIKGRIPCAVAVIRKQER